MGLSEGRLARPLRTGGPGAAGWSPQPVRQAGLCGGEPHSGHSRMDQTATFRGCDTRQDVTKHKHLERLDLAGGTVSIAMQAWRRVYF